MRIIWLEISGRVGINIEIMSCLPPDVSLIARDGPLKLKLSAKLANSREKSLRPCRGLVGGLGRRPDAR